MASQLLWCLRELRETMYVLQAPVQNTNVLGQRRESRTRVLHFCFLLIFTAHNLNFGFCKHDSTSGSWFSPKIDLVPPGDLEGMERFTYFVSVSQINAQTERTTGEGVGRNERVGKRGLVTRRYRSVVLNRRKILYMISEIHGISKGSV